MRAKLAKSPNEKLGLGKDRNMATVTDVALWRPLTSSWTLNLT